MLVDQLSYRREADGNEIVYAVVKLGGGRQCEHERNFVSVLCTDGAH
jgi:hypothetical protein